MDGIKVLHGYCIRRSGDPPPPPGLLGVEGAEVILLSGDGLSVWVSESGRVSPSVQHLRDHDRVVRAALSSATPLPLRFGSVFASGDEALLALHVRKGEFEASLLRVEGRIEMGLRVSRAGEATGPASESDPPSSAAANWGAGREYLETRREAITAAKAANVNAAAELASIQVAFDEIGVTGVPTVSLEGSRLGLLAHLVQRGDEREYEERVDALRRDRPDLRIDVSGPWAPYSFVG